MKPRNNGVEHKNKAVALNHKFCAVIILKKIR